jgi:acyl-CoA dehydrogenase
MLMQGAIGVRSILSGQRLSERHVFAGDVARARMESDQFPASVMQTAWRLERLGIEAVRSEVGQAKVLALQMAQAVLDRAIQLPGGAGVSHERPLVGMYAYQRTVRIDEGADEVHLKITARVEIDWQHALRGAAS